MVFKEVWWSLGGVVVFMEVWWSLGGVVVFKEVWWSLRRCGALDRPYQVRI